MLPRRVIGGRTKRVHIEAYVYIIGLWQNYNLHQTIFAPTTHTTHHQLWVNNCVLFPVEFRDARALKTPGTLTSFRITSHRESKSKSRGVCISLPQSLYTQYFVLMFFCVCVLPLCNRRHPAQPGWDVVACVNDALSVQLARGVNYAARAEAAHLSRQVLIWKVFGCSAFCDGDGSVRDVWLYAVIVRMQIRSVFLCVFENLTL